VKLEYSLAMEKESKEKEMSYAMGECVLTSSWVFSVLGAAIAIPIGIRRKSLGPLVFYGTTGAMLDIVQEVVNCERERAKVHETLGAKDALEDET